MNHVIVIPSLNPSEKIWDIVKELQQNQFHTIVIVNDGSEPSKQYLFDQLTKEFHCHVLAHSHSKGKGDALKTAIMYAKEKLDCLDIITLNDDGQHPIKDILACAKALEEYPDRFILGVRDFTQTGLCGIPSKHFDVFLQSKDARLAYETNTLLDYKRHNLEIVQVPIDTVPIGQNSKTHFAPIKNFLQICKQLFAYSISSITSFLIDMGLFILFTNVLPISSSGQLVFGSTCLARLCSSIFNFICNKKLVYHNDENTLSTLAKYYILCGLQMCLSAFSTATIDALLPGALYLVKMCVDSTLFLMSYYLQKHIVFQNDASINQKINKIIKRLFAILLAVIFVALVAIIAKGL